MMYADVRHRPYHEHLEVGVRKHPLHWLLTMALLIIALIGGIATPAAAHGKNGRHTCQPIHTSVALVPGDATTYTVRGELCARGSYQGKTLQFLLTGFTYGIDYWDFPFNPERYSYVRAATRAGYATLNIARIGINPSDQPQASIVTVPNQAYVAAQITQQLREGSIRGVHTRFRRIIGVGHSMGAGIWIVAAATYNKPAAPDALILNGWLHATNPTTVAALVNGRHPAQADPKFSTAGLPEGYLTTAPGKRDLFYAPQFADPRVIKKDEDTKQTATIGEATTLAIGRDPQYSKRVAVPVLLTVGRDDSLSCEANTPGLSCADNNAILARETPHWDRACLDAYVQPRSGHDSNLHFTAPLWFKAANSWIDNLRLHRRPVFCRA